jgi:hypothetical protein
MDELGSETAEDSLNLTEGRVWGAMLDEYKWLIVGVDVRAVERVAGDNIDVGREVSLEGGDLGRLARGLASNNGTKLGGWSILSNYTVNDGSFDAVDDIIACAGYKVSISTYFYIFLFDSFSD